jgi:hypothetical protein
MERHMGQQTAQPGHLNELVTGRKAAARGLHRLVGEFHAEIKPPTPIQRRVNSYRAIRCSRIPPRTRTACATSPEDNVDYSTIARAAQR